MRNHSTHTSTSIPQRATHPRRGSIYIIVVGTSLLVSLLGLSALLQQHVNRRTFRSTFDTVQARNNAFTALRIGVLLTKNDPDWRYAYPNGVWEQDVILAKGTYTLLGEDPSDSDLADNATEPVVLTGIGMYGDVTHKTQITLIPANRGFTCLEAALHSNIDVLVEGATLNNDQLISANRNVDADTAAVNCDAEAVNAIVGNTFNGTTTSGITTRTMPDVNDVFAYYLDNGTVIDRDSLPLGYSNVLSNPGFESGTTAWSGAGCTVTQDPAEFVGGVASGKVTGRTDYRDGPEQVVTEVIQNGVTCDVGAWVKTNSTMNVDMTVSLRIDSSGDGVQWFDSSFLNVIDTDGWKQITGSLTPTWTGTLNSASLLVTTENGDPVMDFHVDDLLFKESGSERTIHNKVLSPNSNPFGPTTNKLGIYIIDLATARIFIKNTRIVGTLVLIRPSSASRIGGGSAVNWEPAVAGFPALLVDNGDITINPSDSGLNESAGQINFNPPGTPYQGNEDVDQLDIYSSEIKGLIYSTKKIKLKNRPTITGAVIADDDVEVWDTLNLTWNPAYLTNPPPGFQGADSIRILLDSAGRAVD